jgi:hypothetical protein
MKNTLLAVIASFAMLFGSVSCSQFSQGRFHFPWTSQFLEVGLMYELEPGIYVVLEPADKGGYTIQLKGEGKLNEYITVIDGGKGLEIRSPNTNITYQVTQADSGKLKVVIVAADGKLQSYQPKQVSAAVVTDSGK